MKNRNFQKSNVFPRNNRIAGVAIRSLVLLILSIFSDGMCYAGTWEQHYGEGYVLKDNNALEFNEKGVMYRTGTSGYYSTDAEKPKIAVYLLDRNIDDRLQEKWVYFTDGHLLSSDNSVFFDVLTQKISFIQEASFDSLDDNWLIRVVPYINKYNGDHDSTGGVINFLSEELCIKAANSLSDKFSEDGFKKLNTDSLGNNISLSLSAVKMMYDGSIYVWDKTDFPASYFDDLNNNGAEKVEISVKNDLSYSGPVVPANSGYVVRAIENIESYFSLHSSEFVITAYNNAVSPYSIEDGDQLSSASIGVLGQGGVFSFRSGEKKWKIIVQSDESAFSDELVIGEHKTESYGILLLSKYNPIVEVNEKGKFTGNKKMLGMNIVGSRVDFLGENGAAYIIASLSKKDAAYGILSAGSDNKINFAGDVTIASYSLGNPVDKKGVLNSDGHAYGLVNVSTYTEVIGAEPLEGQEVQIVELDHEIHYDSGSAVNLKKDSTLKLFVNSTSGNAFGILQLGESRADFDGSVKICLNNKEGIVGYRDSYAIFVSGDDREVGRTERGRVVNVNGDLFINVSDVEKLNILKKARAAEAKGGGLININVINGEGNINIHGDLHTDKSIAMAHGTELQVPDGNNFLLGINILSWTRRHQEESGRSLVKRAPDLQLGDDPTQSSEFLSEGRINFVMNQKDSYLVGAANGNIDMEIGSGTLWSVTDDSIFENLRPTGGTIDLHHAEDKWNEANPYQYLMVKNITDEAYLLESGTRTVAPAENSLFILNTNIMGDPEKDGKRVFSFDGITYYNKVEVVLAKNLLLKLRRMLPAEAGIQVAAGTMAPHTLPVGFKDDFEEKVGRLPERLEVFGRMTNPGEGLIDYEKRLERYAESEKELQRETAELLRKKSALLFFTDGDQVNRGRLFEEGWKAFREKEPLAKPVLVAFTDDEETKREVNRLAEVVPGLITADARELLLNDESMAAFIAKVFYTPCLDFTLSADTLFAFDKHVLKPEGIAEIHHVAEVLAKERKIIDQLHIRFSITAHTDRIGTYEYNDRLSERRLNTVLRQLEKEGVDMSLFVIRRAEGEYHPVTGDACKGLWNQEAIDCLQPDRRVEIRMVRPE